MRGRRERLNILVRQLVGSCFAVLLLTQDACGDKEGVRPTPPLWHPTSPVGRLPPTPQATRSETVEFNVNVLRPPSNKEILLTLPGNVTIKAVISSFEPISASEFVWRGTIDGEQGGSVRLSVVDNVMVGNIVTARGHLYKIRSEKDGIALVEELDVRKFPREEGARRQGAGELPARPLGLDVHSDRPIARIDREPAIGQPAFSTQSQDDADLTQIDVLVLYTALAADSMGQGKGVTATINQLKTDTNDSYNASNVKQHIRIVHSEQTTFEESDDMQLNWLSLKVLPEVGQLRPAHSADVVVMLTRPVSDANRSSCGQSDQMHDLNEPHCNVVFSVVPTNCATDVYSFAHELGHVMGADHNVEATRFAPPFDFSAGFIAESKAWHTIMAYAGGECVEPECQRVGQWSNPDVSFSESKDGDPSPAPPEKTGSLMANNAAALNQTRNVVAGFSDQCN